MKVIFLTIETGKETKHIMCGDSLKEVQKAIFKEIGKHYSLKECNAFISDYKINEVMHDYIS